MDQWRGINFLLKIKGRESQCKLHNQRPPTAYYVVFGRNIIQDFQYDNSYVSLRYCFPCENHLKSSKENKNKIFKLYFSWEKRQI